MKARIGTMVAAVAAAASAAGAAAWTRRKRAEKGGVDVEVKDATASHKDEPGGPNADVVSAASGEGEAASEAGVADDLTTLKGLGALSAERLAELGVTRLAQIAAWSDADVERIAPQINIAADRIRRDDWVGQARAATKG